MEKLIHNKLRLWLIILFSFLSSYSYAYDDVKIEGYNSVDTYNGYPLFKITSVQINVSSTSGSGFDEVCIDGSRIAYSNGLKWSTYTLDIAKYLDGNLHKLQLNRFGSPRGICYFSDTDLLIDGIFYSVSGETASVISAKKDIETANILSEFEYNGVKYPVRTIGSEAFSNCTALNSIIIPNSVTSIDSSAFYNCSGLIFVSIPNSVTSIEGKTFEGCSAIKEITFEDGEETLSLGYNSYSSSSSGKGLFNDCPLEKLYLGRNLSYRSVSSVGYSPFYGKTTLTELTIGNSVTTIGTDAFRNCSGLTSVSIPNSVTSIGDYGFSGCTAIKEIMVEDGDETLLLGNYNSVEELFSGCPIEKLYLGRNLLYEYSPFSESPFGKKTSLTELTIGNSVTYIDPDAFESCSGLTSVAIGNSVTTIGKGAFRNCSGLTSVSIPNSVTTIGESAFWNCSGLTSVSIPNSVTNIGTWAFNGCSGLTSVNISDIAAWSNISFASPDANPLYYVHDLYLNGEKIENLIIPNDISLIKDYAFYNCSSLTSLTIPNSVTTIGDNTFYGCTAIKEIMVEDGDETLSVGGGLFNDCPLEKLYLGRNLSYNGISPFYNQKNLTELTIGNSVTSIGSNTFSSCSGLTSVNISDIASWCKINFASQDANPLYYAHDLYLNGEKIENLIIPNDISLIKDYVFYNCSSLTSLTIPNSVTTIGDNTFYGCTAIKEITLEDGSETLSVGGGLFNDCPLEKLYLGRNLSYNGNSPFYNLKNLTELTIGNSVTTIGDYAFEDCSGLTSVTIGNSVTTIGQSTFRGCSGLTSVTIPNSVTSIGEYAFSGCSGLTSVTIPNSVTTIGDNTFYGCTAIKEITLEDGSETLSVGGGLFNDCPLEKLYLGRNLVYPDNCSPFYSKATLTDLTVGDSVTSIETEAFYGCSGLTSVTIPNSVTTIGDAAFSGCSSLTTINLSNTITTIGDAAFEDCSSLTSFDIPNDITTISSSTFKGCSGLTSISIPNSVTTISDAAFDGCSGLTSITIPPSIVAIENFAFNGCISIKEISFEDAAEPLFLGYNDATKGLFYDCSLEKLYLGRNLSYETGSSYGYSPFYGQSNLTELSISSSVTTLPENLFRAGTGLKSIIIPNSVTNIDNYAFNGCTGVKEITFENGSKKLSLGYNGSNKGLFSDCPLEKLYLGRNLSYETGSVNGYSPFCGKTTLNNLILGQSVSQIVSNCFSNCTSLKEFRSMSYTIDGLANSGLSAEKVLAIITPDELNAETIEQISKSNLTYFNNLIIEINDKTYSIVSAPNYVDISDCAIKNSTIQLIPIKSDAVAKADAISIVNAYFRGDDIMSELCDSGFKFTPTSVWKENIFDIYANSNAGGDYRHVTMKQAGSLFDELGLHDIQNLKHLKITGDINGTDIMTINRMTSLKYLDLTDANIVEGGVTYRENLKTENDVVGSDFFYNIALETVLLPESAKTIANSAFRNSPELKNVVIGKSVASIGDYAFNNCKLLNRINIPAPVSKISQSAFSGCPSLEYLFFEDSPNTLSIGSTFSDTKLKSLYWGRNISSNTPFNENEYLNSLTFGKGVTTLESSSFKGCSGLTSVSLPEKLTIIPSSLFENCRNLQSVVISGLVRTIENNAFYNTALTDLTIPGSVTSIGNYVFNGCTAIKEITFEDGDETLKLGYNYYNSSSAGGKSLFYDCPIEKLYLGRNLSYNTSYGYGYSPFYGKINLADATIGSSVTKLPENLFNSCNSLTTIIIPNSVNSIGKEAFSGCSALQAANIPDGIVSLPEKVFYGTGLTEVSLPSSIKSIGASCFGNTPTITKVVSLNTTPPEIKSSTFDSEVEEKAMLHVPKGSLVHYWLDPVWKEFGNMSDDILCLDVIPDATYGDPEIDLSQFAPEGVELVYETSNSDVIEINGTMMRIVGAGEATVGAMLADGGSQMQLMGQMRQFKVNKADLSVTVADINIAQGQALPEFAYMVEGLVYDDTVDDIETMPQAVCDVNEDSAPGEYAVEFTKGSDRNYEITTKPAKVTVTAVEPPVSNIDDIDADSDDEIEVYDMKGIRLYKGPRSEAHLAKGFYLVRQGGAVAKVYVE